VCAVVAVVVSIEGVIRGKRVRISVYFFMIIIDTLVTRVLPGRV
jgi:hypothetical protein